MASIAIMVGGAVVNAAAFIGGNYLARALGGGDKAALEEKKRHNKALEDYNAACAKYMRDRTKLLDWIATSVQVKEQAKQNFNNTDYAFKLYNQAHPDERMVPTKEPKFSDFYQPSEQQKKGELVFVGAGALATHSIPIVFVLHSTPRYKHTSNPHPRLALETEPFYSLSNSDSK